MPPLGSFAPHWYCALPVPDPRRIQGQGDRQGRIFSVQSTGYPTELEFYFDFCI